MYISEISPPEKRGSLLVLEEFSIVSGIVVAFWMTYGTRIMAGEWAWRLPFLIQIAPGLVLGVGILFLPFSPRCWLASKGRNTDALEAWRSSDSFPRTTPESNTNGTTFALRLLFKRSSFRRDIRSCWKIQRLTVSNSSSRSGLIASNPDAGAGLLSG